MLLQERESRHRAARPRPFDEPRAARALAGPQPGGGGDGPGRTGTLRTRLFQSPVASVDQVRCHGERPRIFSEGFSAEFQVRLPYRGLSVWYVGGDEVVGDANQVLYVSGGESYRLSAPLPGGYDELVVTPSLALLAHLARTAASHLPSHPLFRRRSRRAGFGVQLMRARFLHGGTSAGGDRRDAEGLLVGLLRCVLEEDTQVRVPGPATRRLIRRTKEFVEGHLPDPIHLHDAARAVGASPAYLTDVFTRCEGLPLHKYVLQLRLARALVELPHARDLTALALDLGFSSHSHFTAAFGRAYGCTPSAFRDSTRPTRSEVA